MSRRPPSRTAKAAPVTTKNVVTGDSFSNFEARLGIGPGSGNQSGSSGYTYNPITRVRAHIDNMYRSSWIVGTVVDCVAEDMTRAGIECLGIDPGEADALDKLYRRMGVWTAIEDTIKWARLYGGAIGVIMLDGQDVSQPLRLDTVGPKQFRGIVPIDRWQLDTPSKDICREFGPHFGLPLYYKITDANHPLFHLGGGRAEGAVKIHHSRVIRQIGVKLPYWQATTENGWGMSVIERLFDRLLAFDSTTQGAAQLVFKAHLRLMKIKDLRQLIGAGGKPLANLTAQMDMIRRFQSSEGMTLIDGNDDFQAFTYAFSGLDAVLMQMGQQISGAVQIPLTRLFGQSPAGMNSTGESDLQNYYDMINQRQESALRQSLGTLNEVAYRSEFGKEPPKEFNFGFEPLREMSEEQRAAISTSVVTAVTGAYTSGIVTNRATLLKELRSSSDSTGLFGHITDDEIEEAENEAPPLPEGHTVGPDGSIVPQSKLQMDMFDKKQSAEADGSLSFTGDAAIVAPLYVRRDLKITPALRDWANEQGITLKDNAHVTICYSRSPVDWFKPGESYDTTLKVAPGGPRRLARMGSKLALLFSSRDLEWRHRAFCEAGARWDYQQYRPHISLCDWTDGCDKDVQPYQGELEFSHEVFEDLSDA